MKLNRTPTANEKCSVRFICLCLCLPLLFTSSKVNASSAIELELPLIVNKALSGDISSSIEEQATETEMLTQVSISIARFIKLTEPFANEEQLSTWLEEQYQEEIEQTQKIELSTLQERGLDIKFDASSLSIHTTIPRLGVQGISLSDRGTPHPRDYYQQSFFSTGLNFIARNSFNHEESNGTGEGFGDTIIDIAGFTSIGGFNGVSLFYEGSYIENDEREFARQNVTLIYDDFKNGIRYALGDVRPATPDLQTSPDLLGINIERNYQEINPFRNINPNGRSSFTLDRASRVSFEVNGVIVETQNLEPGSYSIRDFPLAAGANDVRVFIDDGTSRLEVANFSTYLDFDLLDPGLSNFGISAGFQRRLDSGRARRYEEDPSFLAFYQRGINQNLTLGVSLEVLESHRLVASSAVYGTRYGLFAAQLAASKRDGFETGYSTNLNYSLERDINSNWSIEADVQASYQSDQFINITESTPSAEQWSANARIALTGNAQSFSLNTGLLSSNGIETESFSTTYTRTFRGFGLSAGYQYTKTNNNDSDSSITFRVSKAFFGGGTASRTVPFKRKRSSNTMDKPAITSCWQYRKLYLVN